VRHSIFDTCAGVLVLASTLLVGLETEYFAQTAGETSRPLLACRTLFSCAFVLELSLRVAASGRRFLWGDDWRWNIFDVCVVLCSTIEVFLEVVDSSGALAAGRGLRVLRILRIARAFRIGRVLQYTRTFRQIAYAIQSSMGTLMWIMVMVFLVLYCFAVCFCQATADFILDAGRVGDAPFLLIELSELYGTVPCALYSLFLAMSGGEDWGVFVRPLRKTSWVYTCIFIFFISFTFFGVLNIVTAVFVDSAMQSQQHEKDLLIQEKEFQKKLYLQHIKKVFREIDTNGTGDINADEMEFFLTDEGLKQYLESVDVSPNDARVLFRLLDQDEDGVVSIDDFCEGCLRLKGEAKSFDIHVLLHNTDVLHAKMGLVLARLEGELP